MKPFYNTGNGLITFVTTNECGARCAHCLMNSGPERHEKLTALQIEKAIECITEWYDAKVVVFTGGECTRPPVLEMIFSKVLLLRVQKVC